MNRPTWVVVVGIIGIILGCIGIYIAGYTIMMPMVMDFSEEIMTTTHGNEGDTSSEEDMEKVKMMIDAPDWFLPWSIIAGLIGVIISGFYIFASIGLLMLKKSAVKIFFWVVGVCIGFTLLKGIVAITALPFIGPYMMVGGIVGIVIDIILLVVVANSDKSVFYAKKTATH